MNIQLHDYSYEPTMIIGKPKCDKVLEYRYSYQGNDYLVEVELDYENVALICLYELDDNTVKYAGDSGKNLYLVFNRLVITKSELIKHCNEWLDEVADIAFKDYE